MLDAQPRLESKQHIHKVIPAHFHPLCQQTSNLPKCNNNNNNSNNNNCKEINKKGRKTKMLQGKKCKCKAKTPYKKSILSSIYALEQ